MSICRTLLFQAVAGSFFAFGFQASNATTYTPADGPTLQANLNAANPGDIIQLNANTNYKGVFVIRRSGVFGNPITLTGPSTAVLTHSDGADSGYELQLINSSYWHLTGFTVANLTRNPANATENRSRKGIVLDGSSNNLLENLGVYNIDQEGIHFRSSSANNTLRNSNIHDTGVGKRLNSSGEPDPWFGEGVYIGSNNGVNPTSSPNPNAADLSSGNCIEGNNIGPNVAAEGIDVKEGTNNGWIIWNVFNVIGLTNANSADSAVDVKGQNYFLFRNQVLNPGHLSAPNYTDALQVHAHGGIAGSGNDNLFRQNYLEPSPAGYGINIVGAVTGNRVCTNDNNVVGGVGVTNIATTACGSIKPNLVHCSARIN